MLSHHLSPQTFYVDSTAAPGGDGSITTPYMSLSYAITTESGLAGSGGSISDQAYYPEPPPIGSMGQWNDIFAGTDDSNLGRLQNGSVLPQYTTAQFFQRSLQSPPPNFRGSLNSEGDHQVRVRVPAGQLTNLIGTTLYFAAISYSGTQASLSSVAVPIVVVP